MQDLPVQIALFHAVVIHKSDATDSGRREIKSERRTESAGPHQQNPTALEPLLPAEAHFGQQEMAAVSDKFPSIQFRERHVVSGHRSVLPHCILSLYFFSSCCSAWIT
jgi:hypothetical protein